MKNKILMAHAIALLSGISIMAASNYDVASNIPTGAGMGGYYQPYSHQPEPGVLSPGQHTMYNPNDPRDERYGSKSKYDIGHNQRDGHRYDSSRYNNRYGTEKSSINYQNSNGDLNNKNYWYNRANTR